MHKFPLLPLVRAQLARRRGWAGIPLALAPGLALAGPSGGDVVAGSAAISAPDAHTTQIDQHSQSAIINWQQFSVGAEEFVLFNQPSSSAVVLNRVIGGSMSEILGQMQANGQVFLVNPMGVLFGQGSRVDVGGLVATTLDISDADFSSGNYAFSGASTAGIHSRGTITADQGFVVLSADQVQNTGLIQAIGGNVVLASASGLSLDIDGRGLISYQIDQAALSDLAGIDNLGQILADGGAIALHADVARQLAGTAINNQGQLQARGIAEGDGGEIYLTASGGDIVHNGSIDVSGTRGGTTRLIASDHLETTAESRTLAHGTDALSGGFVELSGHGTLKVRGDIRVAGGTLLVDPKDITIGDGADCDATVCEVDLENQLSSGANVSLIASNSITLDDLSDNELSGESSNGAGSLFMGIGAGTSEAEFDRSSGGTILFADTNDSIATADRIRIVSGTGPGNTNNGQGNNNGSSGDGSLTLGSLRARDIELQAGGAISAQGLTATGTRIQIQGDGGDIQLGSLNAAHTGPAGGSVDINISNTGTGAVTTGQIDARANLASGDSSHVSVYVQTEDGTIRTENVTLSSRNTAGGASAYLDLRSANGQIDAATVVVSVEAQGGSAQGQLNLVSDSAGVNSQNLTLTVRNDGLDYGSAYGDMIVSAGGPANLGSALVTVDSAADQRANGNLSAQAFGGALTLAGADLQVRTGSGFLNLYGADALTVTQGVNLLAGGGTSSSDPSPQTRVSSQASTQSAGASGSGFANLGSQGRVSVGAGITVRTDAATIRDTSPSFSSERISGNAQLNINAGSIDVTGGLTIDGAGFAMANLSADGDVTVRGLSRVNASSETNQFTGGDSSQFSRTGNAFLLVRAGDAGSSGGSGHSAETNAHSTATLDQIEVRGPNAFAAVDAGRIQVGTGGAAIRVEARTNGADGSGAYNQSAHYGGSYTSSRASALLSLVAHGSGEAGGILVDGSTTVQGPEAFAALVADADIKATGAITVSGTGYDISGSGDPQSYGGDLVNGDFEAPPITDGRVRWGSAGLTISGGLPSGSGSSEGGSIETAQVQLEPTGASSITLEGAVSIRGIGAATAHLLGQDVQTAGLSVDAASQGYGEAQGSYTEFGVFDPDTGQTHDIEHTISNGGEGAATYGQAGLQVQSGPNGTVRTGDWVILGGTADASIEGDGASIETGSITVQGSAANATAPYWQEQTTYHAVSDGSEAPPETYLTEVLGGQSVFTIGFDEQLAASILTGDITVSGNGLAGTALQASSIQTGSIDINAAAGLIRSDDPRYGQPLNQSYADAVLLLDASSGESTAQTGAVTVNSSDAVQLAAQLRSSGDIEINAANRLDDQLPASVAFRHPLEIQQFGADDDFELPQLPSNDLSAAGNLNITSGAQGISLVNAALGADQNLSVTATGLNFSGGRMNAEQVQIDALAGALNLTAASINANQISLSSSNSLIADTLLINNASANEPSGTVTITAPDIQIGNGSLIGANDLTLTATNQLVIRGSSLLNATTSRYTATTQLLLDEALMASQRFTLSSAGSVVIQDSRLGRGGDTSAEQLSIDAGSLQISGSELLAQSAALVSSGTSSSTEDSLRFDTAAWTANTLTVNGSNATIANLTTDVSNTLTLDGSTVSGSSLSLDAANLVIQAGSRLQASGTLTLDNQTLQIANSVLEGGASQFSATANASASNSTLRLGDASWSAGNLELSGNTLFASTLTADASQTLSLQGGTLIANQVVLSGSSITLSSGAQVSGSTLTRLQSRTGNVLLQNSSIFFTSTGAGRIEIDSGASILLGNSSLRGGLILLTADNTSATPARALTQSELSGPAGRVVADEGSLIDALALGIRSATLIDLSRAETRVGNGLAGIGADSGLLDELSASSDDLLPTSAGPNAHFEAPTVKIGKLGLVGDYLSIAADALSFNGTIDAPIDLFVHLRPLNDGNGIALENGPGTAASGISRFDVRSHLLVFPGTTFAFGGSDYSGQIRVGSQGTVDLGSRPSNFVFLADSPVQGIAQLRTAGRVALLGGAVALPPDTQPQLQEFQPQSKQDNLESRDTDEQDEDKDQQSSSRGQSQQGQSRRYVAEESSAEVALECQ